MFVLQRFYNARYFIAIFFHYFHHHTELGIFRFFYVIFQLGHAVHALYQLISYQIRLFIIQVQHIVQARTIISVSVRVNVTFKIDFIEAFFLRNIRYRF